MKKDLLHSLILTCQEATLLIERKASEKISFRKNIQLQMHLWICKACKMYEKHSQLINKALQKIARKPKEKEAKLEEAVKQKIIEKIKF